MKTLLTVDFDMFVPEDPALDMGHKESLIYLKMLWETRIGLIDKMKTDGNEVGFWDQFKGVNFVQPVWVSDSHAYAYSLLEGVSRVVLFDAHHDCWPSDKGGVSNGQVYCHNWLKVWLKGGKNRKAVWVKPEWQDACDLPKDMKNKVEVVTYTKGLDLGFKGAVTPHICRSGCWVPPWLDNAFQGFVAGFMPIQKRCVVPMQYDEWNPMVSRWTEEDLKRALEVEKQTRGMKDRRSLAFLRNTLPVDEGSMKVGSIKSSEFMNCKVEQGY